MNCFHFSNREKTVAFSRKSASTRSDSSRSTDRGKRRWETDSNFSMDMSTFSVGSNRFPSLSQRPTNLRVFTFKELTNATRNFSRALMVGEGGFGCVFKGRIPNPKGAGKTLDVAIKRLTRGGFQGHREWITEVDVLGIVEHPNLVKLIGYCAEDDERGMQRLLVYEFMPNRSVEDHLTARSPTVLSWSMRLRIALDAAHGLKYLHEGGDFQIIFRDLKTSNILLDEHWSAKLSDFGLAREGPPDESGHVSTVIVGTMGYASPEYIHTGRLTAKSDIWSYGIVLYELITGRRPMDRNRPKKEQLLMDWIKPYSSDAKKFHVIIDPKLQAECPIQQAMKLAAVANKCLARDPKLRPRMSEVVEMVQSIAQETQIGFGVPQLPLNPSSEERSCRERGGGDAELKRRINVLKADDGSWFMCHRWPLKLLRAQ